MTVDNTQQHCSYHTHPSFIAPPESGLKYCTVYHTVTEDTTPPSRYRLFHEKSFRQTHSPDVTSPPYEHILEVWQKTCTALSTCACVMEGVCVWRGVMSNYSWTGAGPGCARSVRRESVTRKRQRQLIQQEY